MNDGPHVEQTTPVPVGVGTVWKATGAVQGQVITTTIAVTSYEPHRHFGFTTTSGPIQAQQASSFTPVAGGTRLVLMLGLVNPELAEPAQQQWDKDLHILKELL